MFFIKTKVLSKNAVSRNFGTFKTLHLQLGLQFIALLKWEHPPIIFMFRINKGDIYVAKTMLIFLFR